MANKSAKIAYLKTLTPDELTMWCDHRRRYRMPKRMDALIKKISEV